MNIHAFSNSEEPGCLTFRVTRAKIESTNEDKFAIFEEYVCSPLVHLNCADLTSGMWIKMQWPSEDETNPSSASYNLMVMDCRRHFKGQQFNALVNAVPELAIAVSLDLT